ncbi:MAG: N-formylglutamate amidohydrolase [Bdellovibrio sp.]
MAQESFVPLIVTIPHSGEKVPAQTPWLNQLPEEVLMCDVDRYVDFLYDPALQQLHIPSLKTEWHRYAADLNRVPEDVDASSVQGHGNPAGMHSRGFHWVFTTHRTPLMTAPMSAATHAELVKLIYEPFHEGIRSLYRAMHERGFKHTYHIDAHSMPSLGTSEHRDPGQLRADIVISDSKGRSCDPGFKDLVIAAYVTAGFKVGYNWPYYGGRVTEQYGVPSRGQHVLQVEMNRSLYMDEKSKKLKPELAREIQEKILFALTYIRDRVPEL